MLRSNYFQHQNSHVQTVSAGTFDQHLLSNTLQMSFVADHTKLEGQSKRCVIWTRLWALLLKRSLSFWISSSSSGSCPENSSTRTNSSTFSGLDASMFASIICHRRKRNLQVADPAVETQLVLYAQLLYYVDYHSCNGTLLVTSSETLKLQDMVYRVVFDWEIVVF